MTDTSAGQNGLQPGCALYMNEHGDLIRIDLNTVTEAMTEAAENTEDLYKRGTPETWGQVFKAMFDAAPAQSVPLSENIQYKSELYDEVRQKAKAQGYNNLTMALAALEQLQALPRLPVGWEVFRDEHRGAVNLARVGEAGGAMWTVVLDEGSGLHVESASAQFLHALLDTLDGVQAVKPQSLSEEEMQQIEDAAARSYRQYKDDGRGQQIAAADSERYWLMHATLDFTLRKFAQLGLQPTAAVGRSAKSVNLAMLDALKSLAAVQCSLLEQAPAQTVAPQPLAAALMKADQAMALARREGGYAQQLRSLAERSAYAAVEGQILSGDIASAPAIFSSGFLAGQVAAQAAYDVLEWILPSLMSMHETDAYGCEAEIDAVQAALSGVKPTLPGKPSSELRARCLEIIRWRQTGTLEGDALRAFAKRFGDSEAALELACSETAAEVFTLIAEPPERQDLQTNDPALAVIAYMLEHQNEEPLAFLRCWNEGNFDAIRREWPDAPDEVFIGADPLYGRENAVGTR